MKKLIVILAVIAMVGAFTATAMADGKPIRQRPF